jgi:hypothetical protein
MLQRLSQLALEFCMLDPEMQWHIPLWPWLSFWVAA